MYNLPLFSLFFLPRRFRKSIYCSIILPFFFFSSFSNRRGQGENDFPFSEDTFFSAVREKR